MFNSSFYCLLIQNYNQTSFKITVNVLMVNNIVVAPDLYHRLTLLIISPVTVMVVAFSTLQMPLIIWTIDVH